MLALLLWACFEFPVGFTITSIGAGRDLNASGRSLNNQSHQREELVRALRGVFTRKFSSVVLSPKSLELVNGVWGKKTHAPMLPDCTFSYEQRCTHAGKSLLPHYGDSIVNICQPLTTMDILTFGFGCVGSHRPKTSSTGNTASTPSARRTYLG